MPKATLHENDLPVPGQYDVRSPGQVFTVQPEPITQPVEHRARGDLRLRIFAVYAAHKLRPRERGERVHGALSPGVLAAKRGQSALASGG